MPLPRLDADSTEQIRVWIRVPGEMKREIEDVSRRLGEKPSQFVRRAVETELERMK